MSKSTMLQWTNTIDVHSNGFDTLSSVSSVCGISCRSHDPVLTVDAGAFTYLGRGDIDNENRNRFSAAQ